MIYCQDCGESNHPGDAFCRSCGDTLVRHSGTVTCPSCTVLLGRGARFCGACGAPTSEQVAASAGEDVLDIAVGLELPDWIKGAAARTPHDPDAEVAWEVDEPLLAMAQSASSGRVQVPSTAPRSDAGDTVANLPLDDRGDRSLPPLPDGGLAEAMPEWLRDPPPDQTPGNAALTDTSSFISESDLPHWIRELAAVEAAQEAQNQVSNDSLLSGAAGETDDGLLVRQAASSRLIPEDSGRGVTVARDWLSRHGDDDAMGLAVESRRAAFAQVAQVEPSVAESSPPARTWDSTAVGGSGTAPGAKSSSVVDGSAAARVSERKAHAGTSRRKRLVWAAILLLLALAVAILIRSSGITG